MERSDASIGPDGQSPEATYSALRLSCLDVIRAIVQVGFGNVYHGTRRIRPASIDIPSSGCSTGLLETASRRERLPSAACPLDQCAPFVALAAGDEIPSPARRDETGDFAKTLSPRTS